MNFRKFFSGIVTFIFLFSLSAQADYYPLKIVNKTGNTNDSIHAYVIFMAQDTTPAANHCVMELTYDSTKNALKGTLVKVTQSTKAYQYTYRIDSLEGYDSTTKSVTILVPNTISGRCMVSLNYPLYMPPVQTAGMSGWVLQNPSVSNVSDVNYDIIYDKFEFTYNKKNVMYIDPTAVDFFAIPVALKSSMGSSGSTATASRDTLLKVITGVLKDSSTNGKWDVLTIKDSETILRITAPYLAPNFDTNYLQQNSFNYISTVIDYYKTHVLKINCSQLNETGEQVYDTYGVLPSQDSGAYIFTSEPIKNGLWIFRNNPDSGLAIIDTIDMNKVKSYNFFGPGTTPFLTTNKMVISIIVENITAAFTVGLLPAPDSMIIDSAYICNTAQYPYYVNNKQLNAPPQSGPWYNLYTQALHKAIPQIYAFAFDDVLGQSGTLVSSNNKDTISLTLCDMGDTKIPAHSDLMPVFADTLVYNSGFKHIGRNYIDTLKWKNHINQPPNAKYFFMGQGASFTVPIDSFLFLQYGKFYSSGDTMGWVIVPDSLWGTSPNLDVSMSVYTCGGPHTPCPTSTSNWKNWSNAKSYNVLPKIDSPVFPVVVIQNNGFVHIGKNYIDTIRWRVPANQPSNAQYFFMGNGASFTIPPKKFLSYQYGKFYSSGDTMGWVVVPDSLFGNCSNTNIPMSVYTCGALSSPCPTDTSNWERWMNASSSNIMPKPSNPVLPVTVTYNSGFTKKGGYYVDTIKWIVPSNQPSSARYFFMGNGSHFTMAPDTFVKYQLITSDTVHYTARETTGIIKIPVTAGTLSNKVPIQVMTCGGPGHPCPTKTNITPWTCAIGSSPKKPNKK